MSKTKSSKKQRIKKMDEIQRRDEIPTDPGDLVEALRAAQRKIAQQDHELMRLYMDPLVHATVVRATNELNPKVFLPEDLVVIIDENHPLEGYTGRLFGQRKKKPCVDGDGFVKVVMPNMTTYTLNIGMHDQKQQVKLLGKNDGTNVILCAGGELQEVFGVTGHKFYPGDTVKVNLQTKQIIEPKGTSASGSVALIRTVIDDEHAEVEIDSTRKIVFLLPNLKLEEGDKVELDRYNTIIIRKLDREDSNRHVLREEINVNWNDIGGCEDAKEAIIDAIELPYAYPDIYAFYKKKLPKGILLYGPPGCGKTLIAKAAANSLSKRFGKEWIDTGFILVKGPEILSKWVGMAESHIRELFLRARKHFEKTKCPAVIFIDEAEAILPQRGTGRSSDVDKTIVPMFLSEMDGLETSYAIVILATNRPEMLDPAAIRAGRIDRHIFEQFRRKATTQRLAGRRPGT